MQGNERRDEELGRRDDGKCEEWAGGWLCGGGGAAGVASSRGPG